MSIRRPYRLTPALALPIASSLVFALKAAGQEPVKSVPPQPDTAAATEVEPVSKPFDLWTTDRGTGDWGGVRTDLEDLGIKWKVTLMNQVMVNMHGGKEVRNGHDTAGSYEVNLYLDMEKILGVPDAEFWIRGKGTWGGDDSDFDKEKVGAYFKTNQDASSEEVIFIDKWHWKQYFLDKKLELRIGRQEPVKDLFDKSNIMGHEDKQFLNRALVRNAVIPSTKGLGVFASYKLPANLYISAAVLDADAKSRQTNFNTAFHGPDHFRFFTELGWKPKFETAKGKLPGHYRVGTFYDPARKKQHFDTLDGLRAERYQSGDWGMFMGFDQMVWKENDNPKDKQGISIAGRYGCSKGEVNKIEHFWSFAAQYEGPIPTRDLDVLGFGVAQGIFAGEYRRVHPKADRETVYELYYAIRVAPWLIISPDFQFVTNAGGDKDDDNVMVAGLRVKMSL